MATDRNKIQLTYGDKQSYSKYTLEFLNYSEKAGYEGRFYKFKIRLSETERLDILNTVDDNGRVYKISGIELSYKGTVTEYVCAQTYTYTGYAEGYGSELATGDTLACKVDGFNKYLTLDVRSTYYRPEGSNGSENKQDTLHSVYFAVPNEIIREYGVMTAVHATWLNAYTTPIFVTGNEDYYNGFMELVGKEAPKRTTPSTPTKREAIWAGSISSTIRTGTTTQIRWTMFLQNSTMFSMRKTADADSYTLPAEELLGDSKSGQEGAGWLWKRTRRTSAASL